MQAAHFADGRRAADAQLSDAGAVLQACTEAAAAARRVASVRTAALQPLRSPALHAQVWAGVAALTARSQLWMPPEAVAVPLGVAASVHIPLALMAWGMAWQRAPITARQVPPVRSVLAVRLLSGLLFATLALVACPPLLRFVMRCAAIAVCLVAPISPQARSA